MVSDMKEIRKLVAALCCAILLLPCIAGTASAAGSPELTVESAGVRRGDTVTVTVSLREAGEIAGGNFTIQYDATRLTLVSAEAGEAVSGSMATVNPNYGADKVRLTFAGTSSLTGGGVLLAMTFRIREDAAQGEAAVEVAESRFYDVNGRPVSATTEAGCVTVEAVQIAISSEECLPGQAVSLAVELSGSLRPAGGEFEIHYNPRLLTAGSVKAEQTMGSVQVNLSYNIDKEQGIVKVSWAAAEPVGELGRLCVVTFAVAETAAGDTAVTLENVRCYDEDAIPMDCADPENGTVTVVEAYNPEPTLYVVGGMAMEDGTAVVQVALDGAGIVCGGKFTLRYDVSACELKTLTTKLSGVAVNPEIADHASGVLTVAWAENSPSLDNETILELTFQVLDGTSTELLLEDVVLYDNGGEAIPEEQITAHNGKVGITDKLQVPQTVVRNSEDAVEVSVTLYDAGFCGEEKAESAQIVVAGYADGKFQSVTIPASALTFDHNGIASADAEIAVQQQVDQLKLFVLESDGTMVPLCEDVLLAAG